MLSAALLAFVLLQVKVEAKAQRDTAKGATSREINISIGAGGSDSRRRPPKRIPVTAEHLRTAFRSPLAKSLLERARVARMAQDSALVSYDATAYLRVSAGMGFSKIGRDRLLFRHENVTRVQWKRDVGAWIDVKGARTAIPVAPEEAEQETSEELDDSDMTPLPYFPGQEPLIQLNGNGVVKSSVDERDMVHPLAEGAEAYYTYEVGDSVTFHLPDGRAIELRELRVRPRESKWNVAVGSLWFDSRSGQLVRAAYRFAVPMDVWAIVQEEDSTAQDDIPKWVKPLISPMRAAITAAAVEYGLYQGRFWMPRIRSAEGEAQVSFMHVPFKFEESFRFTSVNGTDSLPPIDAADDTRPQPPDSLDDAAREKWRDSVREVRRDARRAARDSVRKGLKADSDPCHANPDSTRMVTRRSYQGTDIKVAMRVPCDVKKLASSPELPKSIYDEGEEIFGVKERDALIKEALAMGAQPPFAFGHIPPTLKWGLEFVRFNRVEGFSAGAMLEQPLGAGYTASLLARLGHADLEPNGEVTLSRTNLVSTVRGRAYNRLVSASDWGNPLSFGSSLSALLFGRDEGFYYRATGTELEWETNRSALVTWRLFAEKERTADVANHWSLGPRFIPNISAREGTFIGAAARVVHTHGLDPRGFRTFTDLRFESAVSDSASAPYGRGALDVTLTQGMGPVAASVTLSGGSSVGNVPAQRLWYLGGAHTVRGQKPDTAQRGNAFWLGRLELGAVVNSLRPIVFGDVGWVGDRTRMQSVGRPMSGVGVGASVLDGLIRADISRGLYPRKRYRLDAYLDARF